MWLTLIVALISLTGVILTAVLVRRTGKESNTNAVLTRLDGRLAAFELDKWRRREETMRMLRWAAEKAVNADDDVAAVGVAALEALGSSELLQEEDQALIDKVVDAILMDPLSEYAETQETETDEVEVVQDDEK